MISRRTAVKIKFMRVVYRALEPVICSGGDVLPVEDRIALRFNRDESVYTVRKFKEKEFGRSKNVVKVLGHELYHHEEHRRKLNKSQYWSHKNCDAFGDALWRSIRRRSSTRVRLLSR